MISAAKVSFFSICRLKCPVCGAPMEFQFPSIHQSMSDECNVQSFTCSAKRCGLKWTGWGLEVEGLKEAYEREMRKRAKEIQKAQKARDKAYSAEAHTPMDATCEKCGRIYCDYENKY